MTQMKQVSSQRRKRGLTLYEFNHQTRQLQPVTLERIETVLTDGKTQVSHRVKMNEDCVYFQALNMKNAQKKAMKFILRNIDTLSVIEQAAAEADAK